MINLTKNYDLFISHASEDKDEIVRPLALKLRSLGLQVWYDEFTLHIGDSLTATIDKGIRDSHYGVVILSKDFFAKKWPREELDALYNKSILFGRKVILPIWHNVTQGEVYEYSPLLAKLFAISTVRGIDYIANDILLETMGRGKRVHFETRSELPPFRLMLSLASKSIGMSGLDFRIVVHSFMNLVRFHLNRGIQFTFLVLDPDSKYVETQGKNVYAGFDLKSSIEKSLRLLCEEEMKLPSDKKANLLIKKYDYYDTHSIIVIDRDNPPNEWIKVENRPAGSEADSRPSDAAFRNEDENFFSDSLETYQMLLSSSKEVSCEEVLDQIDYRNDTKVPLAT